MQKKSREEIVEMFKRLNIDYSRPGFYDTPEFKAVEKRAPAFIAAYAEYVDSLELSREYLEWALNRTLEAADFVFSELVKDGRKGACIDESGVLQRMLDREGIWNYLVGGGVRIQFPEFSGIPDEFFWPLVHPDNPAKTGHAWLRVPPFAVLDITLPVQPYSPQIATYFDGHVVSEEAVPYQAVARDLYENELIEMIEEKTGRPPTLADLAPWQKEFMTVFPAFGVRYRQLRLKYIPMNITAIDGDLEEMQNLCLSGKYPMQLYEEFQKRNAKK